MRLTKVVNKGMNETPIYVGSYGNIVNVGDNQATSMVHNKLGQLEDIEEKYGVESTDDLDKRLKALETIKEKRVDVGWLVHRFNEGMTYEDYLFSNPPTSKYYLTPEEFELLKEELL